VFYDFYGAWDNPIKADADSYLSKLKKIPIDEWHLKLVNREPQWNVGAGST
jgi:hypothetical protein